MAKIKMPVDSRITELTELMYHREVSVRDYDMRKPEDRLLAAQWLVFKLDRAARFD